MLWAAARGPSQTVMDTDSALMRLVAAIVAADEAAVAARLAAHPELAQARLGQGATRRGAKEYFLDAITHYLYAGDTALHAAAAAYRPEMARKLIALGADVRARNRRGAEPLHYAADGVPGAPAWNPRTQAATLACLIEAGADPNAADMNGVAPLHRAVRTRCAAAVQALLAGGADPGARTAAGRPRCCSPRAIPGAAAPGRARPRPSRSGSSRCCGSAWSNEGGSRRRRSTRVPAWDHRMQ